MLDIIRFSIQSINQTIQLIDELVIDIDSRLGFADFENVNILNWRILTTFLELKRPICIHEMVFH